VFIHSADLPDTVDVACGGHTFVFSRDSQRETARRPVGKPYVNFRAMICDVPEPAETMHEWAEYAGEPPTAVAVVAVSTSTFLRPGYADLGAEGRTDIWVKSAGTWRMLAYYSRMMS
jgi:hypothetical protein